MNMNTQTVVGIVIAVIALGGVWYLASNSTGGNTGTVATTTPFIPTVTTASKQTTPKPSTPVTTQPTKTTAQTVGVGSLSYLLGLRQSLVCSVKTTAGTLRSGTLYVSAGMARANLVGSSMIHDGTYLYAWMTGATTGTKLLAASSVSGSAIVSKGGVDPTANLSYACNPWTADTSIFVPPTSVSF